jgi:hypothetical protein
MITKGFEIAMSFLRAKRCILPYTALDMVCKSGYLPGRLSNSLIYHPLLPCSTPLLSTLRMITSSSMSRNDSRRVNSPVSHSATSPEAIKGFLQVIPKLMREYR